MEEQCLINRKHLPPKAFYFLFFAGMASFLPFVVVFAKQLGISEVAIGILFSVSPVTGIVTMPLFGAIADKFKIKKTLFMVFNALSMLFILSFALLPQSQPISNVTFDCVDGVSFITQNRTLSENGGKSCNVSDTSQSEPRLDTCKLKCYLSEGEKNASGSGLDIAELRMTVQVKSPPQFGDNNNLFYLPVTKTYNKDGEEENFCTVLQSCEIHCASNHLLNIQMQRIEENPDNSGIFAFYAFLVLAKWMTIANCISFADARCLQTLGDDAHLYGVQRLWGTIGWGLVAFVSGGMVDWYSQGSIVKDYTPCYFMLAFFFSASLIIIWKWDVQETDKPRALGESIKGLAIQPEIVIFIFTCVFVGTCHGLLSQFLFWYVEDIATCSQMEYIKTILGLIILVQCIGGELPLFYISSWFIKKLGHVHCLTLALFAFGVRFIGYSLLTNPWHTLPIELLHGITFGIFYANMASYAYTVSGSGSVTTVQGIFKGAYEAVGWGLGSLAGGVIFQTLSGRMAFRIFGIAAICCCLMYHFSMRVIKKRFSPVPQELPEGDKLSTSTNDNTPTYPSQAYKEEEPLHSLGDTNSTKITSNISTT